MGPGPRGEPGGPQGRDAEGDARLGRRLPPRGPVGGREAHRGEPLQRRRHPG